MPAAASLTLVALDGLGRISPGDDLADRILAAADDVGLALRDGDVLAVAQKIVSKAENRYAVLDDVVPSPRALRARATLPQGSPHRRAGARRVARGAARGAERARGRGPEGARARQRRHRPVERRTRRERARAGAAAPGRSRRERGAPARAHPRARGRRRRRADQRQRRARLAAGHDRHGDRRERHPRDCSTCAARPISTGARCRSPRSASRTSLRPPRPPSWGRPTRGGRSC